MKYSELLISPLNMTEEERQQEAIVRLYCPMTEEHFSGFVTGLNLNNIEDERFEANQVSIGSTTEGM